MADIDNRPFDTDGSFQQLLRDYGSVVEGVEQRQAQNAPQVAEGQTASPAGGVRNAASRSSGNDGADGGRPQVVNRYFIKDGLLRRRRQVTKEEYDAWVEENKRRRELANAGCCNCQSLGDTR